MPGATIWKGRIHFGETDVAVKLHSAVREEQLGFHLLHQPDQARLRQQMVCALEKLPVPGEEQSRGFEVEEGKYLILEPEELEQAEAEGSRMIEVHEFVGPGRIDPLYVDRVYYLEPDSANIQGKGYAALVKAMEELEVGGICTWTMRKRAYFGALQARDGLLRLSTLRYADEVIPAASLGLQEVALTSRELEIGSELIEKLTASFEPAKFENEHRRKLLELIDRKARGENITVLSPVKLKPTGPDELLRVLEASLKKAA